MIPKVKASFFSDIVFSSAMICILTTLTTKLTVVFSEISVKTGSVPSIRTSILSVHVLQRKLKLISKVFSTQLKKSIHIPAFLFKSLGVRFASFIVSTKPFTRSKNI